MEDKLLKLYKQCVVELKSIGIYIEDPLVGIIDIKISKRNNKRYGCCKQEDPDKRYCKIIKKGKRCIMICDKFNKHHIEISKWVMDLNDSVIKNTIIHELIHCLPYCNNHGKHFKYYAELINSKLNYNISRLGNKRQDYIESHKELQEEQFKYKYEILCSKCGYKFYRQRIRKKFTKIYRCGVCKGVLKVNLLQV